MIRKLIREAAGQRAYCEMIEEVLSVSSVNTVFSNEVGGQIEMIPFFTPLVLLHAPRPFLKTTLAS